jgi:hypothetical protein
VDGKWDIGNRQPPNPDSSSPLRNPKCQCTRARLLNITSLCVFRFACHTPQCQFSLGIPTLSITTNVSSLVLGFTWSPNLLRAEKTEPPPGSLA